MKNFRKTIAGILAVVLTLTVFTGCNSSSKSNSTALTNGTVLNTKEKENAPFSNTVSGVPAIQAPKGFNWKQYAGTTLNVITENTTPSSALSADIDVFENATGITVHIEQVDLDQVAEKVGLDINSKSAKYQLVYADPYLILSKDFKSFVDLKTLMNNSQLPQYTAGLNDFFQSQLEIEGYMANKDHLYALPYDAPTMLLAYRKDVFEKYKDLFQQENGFDWTPGANLTWEQYYTIAKWINDKAKDGTITEVKYGTVNQAKQHDSLQCDFSNVLAAYGGNYFAGKDIGNIGQINPGKCTLTSSNAIAAATFYKKLIAIADPVSSSSDWSGSAEEFQNGMDAMVPEFHEFSANFENTTKSKVAGKVGWALLPKGTVRSANIYGGTGLAISKYATAKQQGASWLFLLWATSAQSQYSILTSKNGGSTPVCQSVYTLADVKKAEISGTDESKQMPNMLSCAVALKAWDSQYVYGRPKCPQWPQIDVIVYTGLSKMLAGQSSPTETMNSIAKQVDQLTGN